MGSVSVEVNEEIAALLGGSPEQVEHRVLEIIVLQLYRQRQISAGRAAEILNREKFAFIRWAGEQGVPYFDMTPEEWQQELRAVRET